MHYGIRPYLLTIVKFRNLFPSSFTDNLDTHLPYHLFCEFQSCHMTNTNKLQSSYSHERMGTTVFTKSVLSVWVNFIFLFMFDARTLPYNFLTKWRLQKLWQKDEDERPERWFVRTSYTIHGVFNYVNLCGHYLKTQKFQTTASETRWLILLGL